MLNEIKNHYNIPWYTRPHFYVEWNKESSIHTLKYWVINTYPDILVHILIALVEALLGFSHLGHGFPDGDRGPPDHGMEQLPLALRRHAFGGEVDSVGVLWTRLVQAQSQPVSLGHFVLLRDKTRMKTSDELSIWWNMKFHFNCVIMC